MPLDPDDPLISHLNEAQAEAVTHHGTPLLIVAGAGSGKTRVITHRIAYLATRIGIPLWQILAVTFTNKAAREMRERVCALLGVADDPSLSISTFHSRCAAMLRREADAAGLQRSFAILDERDQQTAVKKAMEAAGVDDKKVRPGQVQSFINLAKMKLLTAKDCEEEFDGDEIPYARIYKEYEELLRKNNSLDFEDLIFRSVLLFRDNAEARARWQKKYRYILVDEFQDTNHSQFELVKLLTGDEANICVVGDEDQSIYSWRGADVTNLLDFRDAFPDTKLVRLEQNYRSTGNVLKAAGAVIRNNAMRIGKELWTEKEEGEDITFITGADDRGEAELVASYIAGLIASQGISAEEIAVFYRSHALSRSMEDAIRRTRLPYRIVGSTRFYDRAEIKDLLSFLRLSIDPNNDLAFERVVNVPTRGIGKKSLGDIVSKALFAQISQFAAAKQMVDAGEMKGKAAKGLAHFVEAVQAWNSMTAEGASVSAVLKQILEDTKYKTDGVGDPNSIDGARKLENVEEFESVIAEYEMTDPNHTVGAFLENMALDARREEGDDREKVSLMTVHNAKGLEFDHVFVIGLEQGVFPNSRTLDNPEQFEEERRLFYVALTRARQKLYLSRALRRMRHGTYDFSEPSVFLREIPEEMMDEEDRRRMGLTGFGMGAMHPRAGLENRRFGSIYGGARRPRPVAAPAGGSEKTFAVGDRVEHNVLGAGTVTETSGRFGNNRVYVEFDDGRGQEFMVKFAPLTRIT